MTLQRDPPRLLEAGTNVDPVLREALRMASTNAPTVAQLEALSLKVTSATAAAGLGAASGTRGFGLKPAFAKLSVALLIGGTATWLAARELPQSTRPPAVVEQRSTAPVRTPEATAPASTRSAAQPAPDVAASGEHERERGSATTVTRARTVAGRERAAAPARPATLSAEAAAHHLAPSGEESAATRSAEQQRSEQRASASNSDMPPKTSDTPSELTLLGRAQSAMARDPHAALDALEQHAQAYPHGAFTEEREALAIDALRRLGRDREMRARARTFLERYPASPHRERIEAALH